MRSQQSLVFRFESSCGLYTFFLSIRGNFMPLVEASQLKKTYIAGDIPVKAIRGVSFSIPPASFVSFVGPSGSGKSTLLNMIGCLDPPTGRGPHRSRHKTYPCWMPERAAKFRGTHHRLYFSGFQPDSRPYRL